MKLLISLLLMLSGSTAHAMPLVYGGERVGSDDPIAHHAVSIIIVSPVGSCTGTVIGSHWILTAAHCVVNKNTGEVGQDFIVESDDGDWSVNSDRAIAHENYSSGSPSDDVALIYLKDSVPKQFSPARLADRAPSTGAKVYAAGFGTGHSDGGLYKIKLTLSEAESQEMINWHQSATQGTCVGDSGGGVWTGDVLAGVISHYRHDSDSDKNCAGTNYAMSVAYYRNWISSHMQ